MLSCISFNWRDAIWKCCQFPPIWLNCWKKTLKMQGVHNFTVYYASPTSGEAFRNQRLTTNFELWVEIFCVPTCFHMRIPKPCLYPEKRYHHSFVNISPTLVIDTLMERSSRVLHHGNPKIWFFFFKKVRNSNFYFRRRAEITLASSISVLH